MLFVIVLSTGASRASAQVSTSSPPAAVAVPSRRVAPGDSSLKSARLKSDTLTYTLMAYRDGSEVNIGTITDELTRVGDEKPAWRRVLAVHRGQSMLLDSTMTDAMTMAPRQHRSFQPTRKMRVDIAGQRVRGTLGPLDGPGVAIDTTLATPFFDSGNWDLIVRTMPLVKGYEAVFRVYDLDSGLKDYIVRVIGATTMAGEPAHVVQFRLGAGSEATVWIGAESRRLLQVETILGPTTVLRQTLRPTVPSP